MQIALVLVFVRLGEHIYAAPPLPFSFGQLLDKFRASPRHFFTEFASTFLHCITAWALLAPFAVALLYYGFRPILRRASHNPGLANPVVEAALSEPKRRGAARIN